MITVISGTNRPSSLTRRFAHIYWKSLQEKVPDAVLFDLESLPAEILSMDIYDRQNRPESIIEIQNKIFAPVESFVFIFPEYNGSFPGILKLLIDAMDPKIAFKGKKASVLGIATGRGGNLRGMDHLVGVLHNMDVTVMPYLLPVSRVQLEFENESGFKADTLKVVSEHIRRVVAF